VDNYKKYVDQLSFKIFGYLIIYFVILGTATFVCYRIWPLYSPFFFMTMASVAITGGFLITLALAKSAAAPVRTLQDIFSYKFRPTFDAREPDTSKITTGRELVEALRDLLKSVDVGKTSAVETINTAQTTGNLVGTIAGNLPMPVIAIKSDNRIAYANKTAAAYFELKGEVFNSNFTEIANLSFPSEDTFDNWLADCRNNKVTDTKSWTRVRLTLDDQSSPKQFDMIAYFSKGDSTGAETLLAVFDQSDRYNHDDQDVSFLALAVHELRTPLTIMRGLIEVFEEEVTPTLNEEMRGFMGKLHASAQQLTAFVSNILNMARVEQNQLTLSLREEEWTPILTNAINDLNLRAQVHGKQIQLTIDPGLPKVAVDRMGVQEVVNNLVENAIKYSGGANQILVRAGLNKQGLVVTSIQDFGVGIPQSILPHLFEKYYRSHRTKGTASGTGLGLYLCQAIVKAHGGTIAAESHEGKGSTFSFTLLPYGMVKSEADQGQDGIIRGAHGWIKNHNIYKG
jgi:signal transduction histidine kinase